MRLVLGFLLGVAATVAAEAPGVRVGERIRNAARGWGLRRDDETPLMQLRYQLTAHGGLSPVEVDQLVDAARAVPAYSVAIGEVARAAVARAREGKGDKERLLREFSAAVKGSPAPLAS